MVADRRRRTATAFEWPRAYLNVHRSRAHVCVFSLGARDWEYPVSRSFIYAVSVSFFYYRPAPPPPLYTSSTKPDDFCFAFHVCVCVCVIFCERPPNHRTSLNFASSARTCPW
jgi:hypothetical protein